jgi:hypothetical protein
VAHSVNNVLLSAFVLTASRLVAVDLTPRSLDPAVAVAA